MWCTALKRVRVRAAQVSAEARSVVAAAAEALPRGWPHGAGAPATTQVHTRAHDALRCMPATECDACPLLLEA